MPGEGWTTDRKPNFVLRVRAWLALRKYRKAERTYRRLMWEMKTLEAERESVLKTMAADNRAGRLEQHDVDVRVAKLNRINIRFDELTDPWQKADAAMRSASATTQKVLQDIGFRETSN